MLSLKAHIQAQIIISRLQAQNVHFRVEGHGRKNPGSGEIGQNRLPFVRLMLVFSSAISCTNFNSLCLCRFPPDVTFSCRGSLLAVEVEIMSLLIFNRETTLFFSSVYSEDEKLLDYLLHSAQYFPLPVDHKHPMYITNIYGNTPLHAAVRTGNSKAVKLLVEKSEEIQASESEPAEFYAKQEHLLLFPITASKDTALHMDVYSEDEKLLRDILLDSAQYFPTPVDPEHPMHMKNIHGDTTIHVAVSAGNMEAVKLLEGESKKILISYQELCENVAAAESYFSINYYSLLEIPMNL
ncbi:hypothetical protein DKX38_020760 [Salix brachista]|uniref:Uncharacterized protein n=1 Tax=Salix brachista TaxID=2182728 RepID=A0A5N5KBJ9_9ROSI|nr:hypothetical protein DKX38_020760 [Salix brachista]